MDKKTLTSVLVYLGATVLVGVLFGFHLQTASLTNSLFFLASYIVSFLLVSELFNSRAGTYTAVLILALEIYYARWLVPESTQATYSLAFVFAMVILSYYLIKRLRASKLEKTSERAEHFHSLANYSLHPLILKDKNGKVMFASKSLKDLLGFKKNMSFDNCIAEFLHPEDASRFEKFTEEIIKNPLTRKTIELRLRKGDGWIWVRNDSVNLLGQKDIQAIVLSLQDITDQKTVFDKEKTARNLAENAVRERDEFLSIASHELKTPLTSVLLQLQSTLRKISTQSLADFSGGELLKSLQIAEKQSQSLTTLINDLLNVSVASTGRLSLIKKRVNLAEVLNTLVQKYEEEVKLSGSEIKINIINEHIEGNWDQIRIEQAITNLFMNALIYSEKKPISITLSKESGWAFVFIKDNGKGIPESYLDLIFEPFKRVNSKDSKEGLGVGLFIAKQIALAHKGDITVESKLGKGSLFTLKLPLTKGVKK